MTEEMKDQNPTIEETKGKFYESLARNPKTIRQDRAQHIAEVTETKFRRRVEDLHMELRDLERRREASLDMSPNSSIGLEIAKNFDADKFIQTDLDTGVEIHTKKIMLDIARRQYKELFGKEI